MGAPTARGSAGAVALPHGPPRPLGGHGACGSGCVRVCGAPEPGRVAEPHQREGDPGRRSGGGGAGCPRSRWAVCPSTARSRARVHAVDPLGRGTGRCPRPAGRGRRPPVPPGLQRLVEYLAQPLEDTTARCCRRCSLATPRVPPVRHRVRAHRQARRQRTWSPQGCPCGCARGAGEVGAGTGADASSRRPSPLADRTPAAEARSTAVRPAASAAGGAGRPWRRCPHRSTSTFHRPCRPGAPPSGTGPAVPPPTEGGHAAGGDVDRCCPQSPGRTV